jgi:predicted nucleic acid-binding protein
VLYRKFKIPYLDILNVVEEMEASFQIAVVTPTIIKQALLLGERYRYT